MHLWVVIMITHALKSKMFRNGSIDCILKIHVRKVLKKCSGGTIDG